MTKGFRKIGSRPNALWRSTTLLKVTAATTTEAPPDLAMASYQKTVTRPIPNNEGITFHDGASHRRKPWVLVLSAFVGLAILIVVVTIGSGDQGLATAPNSLAMSSASQSLKSSSDRNDMHTNVQVSHQMKEGASKSEDDRRSIFVKTLKNLQTSIEGTVYLPDEDNNELFCSASHVWSERSVQADLAPWAVIEVQNEADVQKVVPVLAALKRQYNFPFRIRSGGHNKAGYSTVPEGAVISLVRLNHISIHSHPDYDKSNGKHSTKERADALATMGPAVLVDQFVENILKKHGFGGVIGFCGTVAEGGFILGGGIGMQSRLYGLGLDNVVGMRIVLADGSVKYVSNYLSTDTDDDSKFNSTTRRESLDLAADLFWALRGAGGGNFGVVTEIEYQLHKANDLCIFYALTLQPRDMAYFLFQLGELESELPGNLMVMHDLVDTASIIWSGRDESALVGSTEYLDSLLDRIIPQQSVHTINRTDFLWTEMYEGQFGNFSAAPTWAAQCWYGYLYPENNTQDIWSEITASISEGIKASAPFLLPDIELWGGAIHNTAWNETAFPHRSAVYNVGVLLTIPADVTNAELKFHDNVMKVNAWWPQVAKYLTGSYVNYPMASIVDQDYPRMYWGNNLERLVKIKKQIDPGDVFQFPLSIK